MLCFFINDYDNWVPGILQALGFAESGLASYQRVSVLISTMNFSPLNEL